MVARRMEDSLASHTLRLYRWWRGGIVQNDGGERRWICWETKIHDRPADNVVKQSAFAVHTDTVTMHNTKCCILASYCSATEVSINDSLANNSLQEGGDTHAYLLLHV